MISNEKVNHVSVILMLGTICVVISHPQSVHNNNNNILSPQVRRGNRLEINNDAKVGIADRSKNVKQLKSLRLGSRKDYEKENFDNKGYVADSVEIDENELNNSRKEVIEVPSDIEMVEGIQHKKPRVQKISATIKTNDRNIARDSEEIPNDKEKSSGDIVTGSIEFNSKNIEGNIELPSVEKTNIQKLPNDKGKSNGDEITGSIEFNSKSIEGNIELPSVEKINIPKLPNDKGKSNGDEITGSIEFNSKSIEGNIELPSVEKINIPKLPNDKGKSNGDEITGSIEFNSKSIEGNIELPSVEKINIPKLPNDKGKSNGDEITGSIEFNSKNIEGNIKLPTIKEVNIQKIPNDKGKSDDGVITGSIESNSKGIEGHIEIEEDNGGRITESEEINEIIDIPNGVGNNITDNGDNTNESFETGDQNVEGGDDKKHSSKNCWMKIDSEKHIEALDDLDDKYNMDRQRFQANIEKGFDETMMEALISSRGAAPRAIHQVKGDPSQIPAGINLGGICMLRMNGSVLFFHRMKLRNCTRFTVNSLRTNIIDMVLVAHLTLNDLHLRGAYERLTTDLNPSALYYFPNFGEIEVLLKNVVYKMEGHLRMLNNRLIIELVNSELITKDILLSYVNSNDSSIKLLPKNIEDFLDRLKTDLNCWLKDYFNDYLMYYGIVGRNHQVIQYEKEKGLRVNEFANDALKGIKHRVQDLGFDVVKIPHFTIYSVSNTQIKLTDGAIYGLDSIYKRSVATTKKVGKIRQLDFIVGFSQLKVEYNYEASMSLDLPPLQGKLLLSSDEVTAQVQVSQTEKPEAFDLLFHSVIQTKSPSLTVEGPANRLIANFKMLLEHSIIAIMTNTMKHNIKMMKTLTRCHPHIQCRGKSKEAH